MEGIILPVLFTYTISKTLKSQDCVIANRCNINSSQTIRNNKIKFDSKLELMKQCEYYELR